MTQATDGALDLLGLTYPGPGTHTRATGATEYDATGILRSIPAGVLRQGSDPVPRENLLLQADNLNGSAWGRANIILTPDFIADPLAGALVADRIQENTTPGQFHAVGQTAAKPALAVPYTFSVYVKDLGRQVGLTIYDGANTSNGATVRFNPATGALTAAPSTFGSGFSGASYSIQAIGTWYRISLTATTNASALIKGEAWLHDGASNTYTGDGTSGAYLFGFQLEQATAPTALTVTGASAVKTGIRTNYIRNAACEGASPALDLLPALWVGVNALNGLSYDVAATGIAFGIPYVDVHVWGTATGSVGQIGITPETVHPAAAVGDTWTFSAYVQLIAGSLANLNLAQVMCMEYVTGTQLTTSQTGFAGTLALEDAAPTRIACTRTFNQPTVNQARGTVYFQTPIGGEVDFTVRIGLPQLEKAAEATDPIISTARTNLVTLNSTTCQGAGWTSNGSTITAAAGADPLDGETTATQIASTVWGQGIWRTQSGLTAGGYYRFSVYAKSLSAGPLLMFGTDNNPTAGHAYFNLSTGATDTPAPGANALTWSMADAGGGWWRCSMIVQATGPNANFILYNGTGGPHTFLVADMMVELVGFEDVAASLNPTPTPYIECITGATTAAINTASGMAGALYEGDGTNWCRNPRMEGGVTGTPGTTPTDFGLGIGTGLTRTIVGFGTEADGVPYMDLRIFGTHSGGALGLALNMSFIPAANSPPLTVGQSATLSASMKLVAGSLPGVSPSIIRLGLEERDAAKASLATYRTTADLPLSSAWTRHSGVVSSTNAATAFMSAFLWVYVPALTACDFTIRIGGIQVEANTTFLSSLMLPPAGTVATSSRGYDMSSITGGAFNALFNVPPAGNLLYWSEDTTQTPWVKASSSVTGDATTAPDGSTTADKIVEAAATNNHIIRQLVTITAGREYVFSCYAKAAERSMIQFRMVAGFTGVPIANFNLAAGTAAIDVAGTGSSSACGIVDVGGGWYRCWMYALADVTTTAQSPAIYLHNGTTSNYLGDGTSGAYVWGMQLEESAALSDYLKTTSAAAVGVGIQGTLILDGMIPGFTTTSTPQFILQLDDGSAANRLTCRVGSAAVIDLFPTAASVVGTAVAAPTLIKPYERWRIALSWSPSGIALAQNGASAVRSAVAAPAGINTLRIGNTAAGDRPMMGRVRALRMLPYAVSDIELAARSAL